MPLLGFSCYHIGCCCRSPDCFLNQLFVIFLAFLSFCWPFIIFLMNWLFLLITLFMIVLQLIFSFLCSSMLIFLFSVVLIFFFSILHFIFFLPVSVFLIPHPLFALFHIMALVSVLLTITMNVLIFYWFRCTCGTSSLCNPILTRLRLGLVKSICFFTFTIPALDLLINVLSKYNTFQIDSKKGVRNFFLKQGHGKTGNNIQKGTIDVLPSRVKKRFPSLNPHEFSLYCHSMLCPHSVVVQFIQEVNEYMLSIIVSNVDPPPKISWVS